MENKYLTCTEPKRSSGVLNSAIFRSIIKITSNKLKHSILRFAIAARNIQQKSIIDELWNERHPSKNFNDCEKYPNFRNVLR